MIGFTKPSRILEIGTFHGGLTLIMRDLLDINGLNESDLLTYDVNTPNFLISQLGDKKITIRTKNLFTDNYDKFRDDESKKELFDYIRDQNYYVFYLDYCYPSDHICVHNDNLEDFRFKFKNYIFPHVKNNELNNNLIHGVNEKICV